MAAAIMNFVWLITRSTSGQRHGGASVDPDLIDKAPGGDEARRFKRSCSVGNPRKGGSRIGEKGSSREQVAKKIPSTHDASKYS
jgi:hypothetical protein